MNDVDRIGGVPGRHEGAARRRPAARRLPHRHRQDDGREPRRRSTRPTWTARSSARWPTPIHATGGLTILQGSLAPEGAVVKTAGFDADVFEGTARVFDRERAAMDALEADEIVAAGDVVVIRYEGPKGGPGMREMLAITGAIKGAGPRQGRAAAHRRPLLRRHDRPVHRPRRARGRRRRSDRLRARRRPDPASTSQRAPSTCWSTRPSWPRAVTAGSRCRRATPAASWPSTPSSCTPPPRAPSAASAGRDLVHIARRRSRRVDGVPWGRRQYGHAHASDPRSRRARGLSPPAGRARPSLALLGRGVFSRPERPDPRMTKDTADERADHRSPVAGARPGARRGRDVFGIPGGAILPAYDPLMDSTKVRHILVRHEQGAGHAAEGYALATGRSASAWRPRGPGATNLVTADRRRLHGLGADGGDHRPGAQRRRSAPTPSRRPTSAASRCRSPSTTSWSPTPTRSRGRSPRRSTSPRPAARARCWSTSPRTRCRRQTAVRAGRPRSTCPATAR